MLLEFRLLSAKITNNTENIATPPMIDNAINAISLYFEYYQLWSGNKQMLFQTGIRKH